MQPPPSDKKPRRPGRKPGMISQVGLSWKLLFHLAIIVGLAFAIRVVWQNYGKAQKEREKARREAIAAQEEESKRAFAEAERRRKEEIARQSAESGSGQVLPAIEKLPETSAQALERLRDRLASGDRSEYPPGAIVRGDSVYLFSGEAMTWPEAAWFAEQHGGHLAYPTSSAVLSWLQVEAADGNAIWLGAAKSGAGKWALADGSRWTPANEPPGTGIHLGVTRDGRLAAAKPGQTLPFVIQWRADGSNPGALPRLLETTRASLAAGTPIYPPGTREHGKSRYLAVHRPISWLEAANLAKNSGGHLAVISSPEELTTLEKITEGFPAPYGLWLGGFQKDGKWQWITGEPWKAASWANRLKPISNAALLLQPGTGIDSRPIASTPSGFIIEWSGNRPSNAANNSRASDSGNDATAGDASPQPVPPEITQLGDRARELMAAAAAKRDEELATNIREMGWNLDIWLRSQVRSEQDIWTRHVNRLKKSAQKNRLPRSVSRSADFDMSAKMTEIARQTIEKQTRIDAAFHGEATRIRDAYASRLRESLNTAQTAGRNADAQSIKNLIEKSGQLDDWLRSIGVEP